MPPNLIEFFILWKLHIGPRMVLGYLVFRFMSWDSLRLFSAFPTTPYADNLDARGSAASTSHNKTK